MALWVALIVSAWSMAPATDVVDSGTTDGVNTDVATTDGSDPSSTDRPYCADCETASERANEEGGTACGSGCSTGSSAPAGLMLIALAGLAVSRRQDGPEA